jgi:ribose 5-phosphate isomerase A
MNQDDLKKAAAEAALKYVPNGATVGVGTGSTVKFFIEALASIKGKIEGTVASSVATEQQLKALHIPVYDLNAVHSVDVYVDGADEANLHHYLIKGRGGALVREKIIATVAKQFICIIDDSKKVHVLGEKSPIPVEVVPMARSYVARQIVKLGGDPVYREGFKSDNGNVILDVYNLKALNPVALEKDLKNITGVVDTGIFAQRTADVVLVATPNGIETF